MRAARLAVHPSRYPAALLEGQRRLVFQRRVAPRFRLHRLDHLPVFDYLRPCRRVDVRVQRRPQRHLHRLARLDLYDRVGKLSVHSHVDDAPAVARKRVPGAQRLQILLHRQITLDVRVEPPSPRQLPVREIGPAEYRQPEAHVPEMVHRVGVQRIRAFQLDEVHEPQRNRHGRPALGLKPHRVVRVARDPSLPPRLLERVLVQVIGVPIVNGVLNVVHQRVATPHRSRILLPRHHHPSRVPVTRHVAPRGLEKIQAVLVAHLHDVRRVKVNRRKQLHYVLVLCRVPPDVAVIVARIPSPPPQVHETFHAESLRHVPSRRHVERLVKRSVLRPLHRNHPARPRIHRHLELPVHDARPCVLCRPPSAERHPYVGGPALQVVRHSPLRQVSPVRREKPHQHFRRLAGVFGDYADLDASRLHAFELEPPLVQRLAVRRLQRQRMVVKPLLDPGYEQLEQRRVPRVHHEPDSPPSVEVRLLGLQHVHLPGVLHPEIEDERLVLQP